MYVLRHACLDQELVRQHYMSGCKHSKVDQTSAPVYERHGFFGQTPISSSKMLFKINYFS